MTPYVRYVLHQIGNNRAGLEISLMMATSRYLRALSIASGRGWVVRKPSVQSVDRWRAYTLSASGLAVLDREYILSKQS